MSGGGWGVGRWGGVRERMSTNSQRADTGSQRTGVPLTVVSVRAESGLQYKDVEEGSGAQPKVGILLLLEALAW